jgi:hypothetical protein
MICGLLCQNDLTWPVSFVHFDLPLSRPPWQIARNNKLYICKDHLFRFRSSVPGHSNHSQMELLRRSLHSSDSVAVQSTHPVDRRKPRGRPDANLGK